MKILFISHRVPYPPNRGGKIRPFFMIQHLAQSHEVTVVSLAESDQELQKSQPLAEYCHEAIVEVLPPSVRWMKTIQALFTNTPSSVAYFWSEKLRKRLMEKTRGIEFDVVVVHCAFVAQYAFCVNAKKRIMDFGDLDSGKWAEYAQSKWFPLSLGYGLEARKLKRFEKDLTQHFQYCTFTTLAELQCFREMDCQISSGVIRNGVNTEYFSYHEPNLKVSDKLVFVGRMDYFPNEDGIIWFVREIFPLIREKIPHIELTIVGSDPSQQVRRLGEVSGVSVTGHVPDVRPYLENAAVAIVPLRIARGVQNKILEAMAAGIPVVATPEAAKGISATNGHEILIGEEPQAFANKVLEILTNHDLKNRISSLARKFVEREYSWSGTLESLDDIFKELGINEKLS